MTFANWISFAAIVSGFLGPALTGWIAWSIRTRFIRPEDLEAAVKAEADRRRSLADDLGGRHQAMEARVQRIESALPTVPSKDELHKLSMAIAGVSGDIKAIRSDIAGVSTLVTRMDTTLQRHEQIFADGRR